MTERTPTARRRWSVIVLVVLAAGLVGTRAIWRRLSADRMAPAEAAYRRGEWDLADRLAAARLSASPGDFRALRLRARSAARLGRDSAARDLFTRLGGAAAMEPEDLWLLGRIIERQGNREAARDCWIEGLRQDPNNPDLLREIVLDRLETGKPIQASHFAARLADQPGWRDRGNILLGKALYADDDPRGAAEVWTRALANHPPPSEDTTGLPLSLARAWLRAGEPARARDLLQSSSPARDDPETSWLLSRSYLQERSTAGSEGLLAAGKAYRDAHPLEPEPAPFVGAARCRECHATVADAFQSSRHARTFHRAPDIPLRTKADRPIPEPRDPSVEHVVRRSGGELKYETREGDRVLSAVVAYAFGSGDKGLTLVGTDDGGRTRELRLSLYEDETLWDVTTGQTWPPQPGSTYLGKVLSEDDLRGCFACHTTVARSARDRIGPESADTAIGCERCHGPGADHLAAVALGYPDLAIARPATGAGAQVVALCSRCHSPVGFETHPTDLVAPRFAGASLSWSRCYTESQGALDCLTCHDPHRNAETSPAYYEKKCLECHGKPPAQGPTPAHARPRPRGATCPVETSTGCVKCHMPRAENFIPHSHFTDHYIRVRR